MNTQSNATEPVVACPECGHRWFAHHHRREGCLYQNRCPCMRVNPAVADEDEAAKRTAWAVNAIWNAHP